MQYSVQLQIGDLVIWGLEAFQQLVFT